MCFGSPLEKQLRGPAKDSKEYYRGGVVSLHSQVSDVIEGSLEVVWLVLGPHHGDSHIPGSRCGGRAPKEG